MLSSAIQVLTVAEAIRKRPQMYFDLNNRLLATHLVAECLCWVPVEAAVIIETQGFGMARVSWDLTFRDLAVSPHTGKPWAAGLLTSVPAPGPERAWETELSCGGGWVIVNAACAQFDVLMRNADAEWGQRFVRGEPTTDFGIVDVGGEPSTIFEFELDGDFLPNVRIDNGWLKSWARTLPFRKCEVV